MKISNLSSLIGILKNETNPGETTTNPLKVTEKYSDCIVVTSAKTEDLTMKLRGVKGISVGSTVSVDIVTGDVKVVEAAVEPPKPEKQLVGTRGSDGRSVRISR